MIKHLRLVLLTHRAFLIFLTSLTLHASELWADSPRGDPELRFCSQNLQRLGEKRSERKSARQQAPAAKLEALATRFVEAQCEIIAVQEIFGERRADAEHQLGELVRVLTKRTGRGYLFYLGSAPFDVIRNGFIVPKDTHIQPRFTDYQELDLPRLERRGAARSWSRSPVSLTVKLKGESGERSVFLLNYHLKSKSHGFKDPTRTEFEVTRMEQAAWVHQLALNELSKLGGRAIGILLGDRNSDSGSASAQIIAGELTLTDFRDGGGCRLERSARVECNQGSARSSSFVPLLSLSERETGRELSTYAYRGSRQILDEILIEREELSLSRDGAGRLAVGVVGDFKDGSDHLLAWTELNW